MIIKNKKEYLFVERDTIVDDLTRLCPNLTRLMLCPEMHKCGLFRSIRVYKVIWHLNDWHEWSRESIADWLANLDMDLSLNSPASLGD